MLSVFYFQSKVLWNGSVQKAEKKSLWADKIAQQVKARAAKSRDLSSVPWTNVGEEKNLKVVL